MENAECRVVSIRHSALDIHFNILISDPRVFATSSLRRVNDEGTFA